MLSVLCSLLQRLLTTSFSFVSPLHAKAKADHKPVLGLEDIMLFCLDYDNNNIIIITTKLVVYDCVGA